MNFLKDRLGLGYSSFHSAQCHQTVHRVWRHQEWGCRPEMDTCDLVSKVTSSRCCMNVSQLAGVWTITQQKHVSSPNNPQATATHLSTRQCQTQFWIIKNNKNNNLHVLLIGHQNIFEVLWEETAAWVLTFYGMLLEKMHINKLNQADEKKKKIFLVFFFAKFFWPGVVNIIIYSFKIKTKWPMLSKPEDWIAALLLQKLTFYWWSFASLRFSADGIQYLKVLLFSWLSWPSFRFNVVMQIMGTWLQFWLSGMLNSSHRCRMTSELETSRWLTEYDEGNTELELWL